MTEGKNETTFSNVIEHPLLSCVWPKSSDKLNLLDSLKKFGNQKLADALKNTLAIQSAQAEMMERPIVGVLGELKSGKSSIVASFLSPEGRQRLPRGVENKNGTHRFVYWLPKSWDVKGNVQNACHELLSTTHGNAKEFLSSDPTKAAEQYRSGFRHLDLLSVPLIASDAGLDQLSLAFLDCPDVQTLDKPLDQDGTTTSANPRLDFVANAAQLCSAFFVVWEIAKLRDGMLEKVLDCVRQQMPNVPLYLLINKITPEVGQPQKTMAESTISSLVDRYNVTGCFAAFDFRVCGNPKKDEPSWEDMTPKELVKIHYEQYKLDGSELPQFFRITKLEESSTSHEESSPQSLLDLREELKPGTLQVTKFADNRKGLRKQIEAAVKFLDNECEQRSQQAKEIHAGLLKFCADRFKGKTGEAEQLLTPEFAVAFEQSFQRTAPLWVSSLMQGAKPVDVIVKPVVEGGKWVGGVIESVVGIWRWINQPSQEIKIIVKDKLDKVRIADPKISIPIEIAQEMKSLRWVPAGASIEELTKGWSAVLSKMNQHRLAHDSDEDKQQMDDASREVWNKMSYWQTTQVAGLSLLKSLSGLTVILGSLVAVVDGGATLMITAPFASSIATALPGVAAALMAVGGGVALSLVYQVSMEQNTLPYLARYFTLACDAFGVPREIEGVPSRVAFKNVNGWDEYTLPVTKIDETETVCKIADLSLWHLDQDACSELKKAFENDNNSSN